MEQIFRANDGTEFSSETACTDYESDTLRIGAWLRSREETLTPGRADRQVAIVRSFLEFERAEAEAPTLTNVNAGDAA